MSSELPSAPFPILASVAQLREWRAGCFERGEKVGFVPTMGALHDGHLSLVKASLAECEQTIVSIFVNPAQFAPHEDLATYPRTLEADIAALSSASVSSHPSRKVSALFLPPVEALYPSGITTDVSKQRGTFLEVKGLQEVMEGASRPGFFRGVATVVIKLFNLVQPTRAYFGQKDIQQALLLRRMLIDLHVPNPTYNNLVILPTYRDPASHLALSSRNAYLLPEERPWATVLVDALDKSQEEWDRQRGEGSGEVDVQKVIAVAEDHVRSVERQAEAEGKGVQIKLLYIAMNDPDELHDLRDKVEKGKGAIVSGAVMLGKTRLIDNIVFEYDSNPQ
ncbi:RHTO0S17e02872g1_1 [Rhodotorula toruloides]|uniref:Pantoate--beta-alanine ligase n=2 Tax=Rhodotorula toruloides TaxID=5286 RepID=A0A061BKE1_RHOTO|nr:pantoate-beta-alanine ligase [Rhodotorula toruloides NP11]EMS20507.1 pantoate-beta-alanine ligase [Rhodotorula toruloides NP11]CDR48405.1 RHTO0S17e02872g1_1 [Rhodotorula toruloides]